MIVAGFGFRTGATDASFVDALARTGAQANAFATLDTKAAVLASFAHENKVPLIHVTPEALSRQATLTRSANAEEAHNTGSVAEAAALAAAGPHARLLGPRVISGDRMATCALAQGDSPQGDPK